MSKDTELYMVMGATGHVGGGIARKLLAAGRRVRVVARSIDRLQPLAQIKAEPFAASADDAAAMTRAFHGATAAFVLIPPDYAAPDYRAAQQRIVAAHAKAAADAKVGHIVILSSIGGHLPAKTGPILGLHEMEEAMNAIPGANVLSLRPAYFMENHLFGIATIKGMGVYVTAMRPGLSMPMIATKDIAAAAAERLLKLDFSGKTSRELLGQRDLTMPEVASVLGGAIGKPDLKYVQAPYADAEKAMMGAGMSASIAGLMIEMNRSFNEGYIKGTEKRTAANTTPTSIEEFAKDFAKAFGS